MPNLSIWTLRIAFLHLILAWSIGAIFLAQRSALFILLPVDVHWRYIHGYMMLFGWLLQVCMGVAFWILPKFTTPNNNFYGYVTPFVAAIITLNVGVVTTLFSIPTAHILLALSTMLFMAHVWQRIKPFRLE